MKNLILFALLIGLAACNIEPPINQDKNKPQVKLNLVLIDRISSLEVADLKGKIQQTAVRLFDDFNIQENEVFNVHVWKEYSEFLEAQERNIGAKYLGSTGYVISENDIAVFYSEDMVENAEHEFVHALSLHINDEFGNNPRWFWESVAIYEAGEFYHPREIDYLKEGNFPSLEELNGMFSADDANKIYQVGYLLSEFIIDQWGREKYLELIKASGDLEGALSISSEEFEEGWKQFVTEKYLGSE